MVHLRRLLGFAIVPALSILSSLVLVPIISRTYGASGWIALSVGSSIGAIVSVLAGLSWAITGGNDVARGDPEEKARLFRVSVVSRLVCLVALWPPSAVLAFVLVPRHSLESVLFMVGISFNALTASWYYSGIGEPFRLVVNEGFVRLVVYGGSAAGFALGGNLTMYATATVVGGVAMLVFNWLTIEGRRLEIGAADLRTGIAAIREQAWGTASRVLTAGFAFGAPTIFSIVAPAALPLYSAMDVLLKAAINATSAVPQAFVAWIGSAQPGEVRRHRMRSAMIMVGALALVFLVAWALLGRWFVDTVFANEVTWTSWAIAALGLTIVITLVARSIEFLVLVPTGGKNLVYSATAVMAVLGIPVVILGALTMGAIGGLWAWTVVHLALLAVYAVHTRRRSRAPRLTVA